MSEKTPVGMLLDGVKWIPLDGSVVPADHDLPVATHEGYLDFCGKKLRCYQLSNGRRVIGADDLRDFLTESQPPPRRKGEQDLKRTAALYGEAIG